MPTLAQYRQFCAFESGRFYAGTIKSSGNATTQATCNALISSLSADDVYNDYWLYFPSASDDDKIRTVKSFSASLGRFTLDRAYSGSTVPDSKAFELHGVLPPISDSLTELSWATVINDALKRIYLEDEFTITPTSKAVRHDVTTVNWWLTEPFQVRQVGYLGPNEVRAEVDPYQGRIVSGYAEKIKDIVYLNHAPRTFQTDVTLYVKALRSAYNFVQSEGTGPFDYYEMTVDTDVAIPSVERVGYLALVGLAKRQGMNFAEETRTRIKEQQADWAKQVTYYTRKEGEQLPELTFRPMMRVGSWRPGRGH